MPWLIAVYVIRAAPEQASRRVEHAASLASLAAIDQSTDCMNRDPAPPHSPDGAWHIYGSLVPWM